MEDITPLEVKEERLQRLNELVNKYHIEPSDMVRLNQYLADRIAGLTLLTLADDKERLNDIIIKYSNNQLLVGDIVPEIEGYVDIK